MFYRMLLILSCIICVSWINQPSLKHKLYLIGDSTVDQGSGNNGLWGWGKYLPNFFDTTQLQILNYAQGGTSARTFYTGGIWDKKINKRGLWDTVAAKLAKGDFLMIQFGLNDQGPIFDSARSRGVLKGIGSDSITAFNSVTGKIETVYSFGWYLRKFIALAKSKQAIPIICSSIPKNQWVGDKLIRGELGFANWAIEIAKQEKVAWIDLNTAIADVYDHETKELVSSKYHNLNDAVHTTEAGAILNASIVAKSVAALKNCSLKSYLKNSSEIIK